MNFSQGVLNIFREYVESRRAIKTPKINEVETNNSSNRVGKVIGGLINKHRIKQRMSLRKLAKTTNLSIALLSSTENGNKIPRIETLMVILKALDIPLNEVFSENIIPTEETAKSYTLDNILYSKGLSKTDVNFINEYINFKTNKL